MRRRPHTVGSAICLGPRCVMPHTDTVRTGASHGRDAGEPPCVLAVLQCVAKGVQCTGATLMLIATVTPFMGARLPFMKIVP
eukprot:1790102-Rhodomonas_salina.3